jgi:hypothetical protein
LRKAKHQQRARFGLRNPARAQIKERHIVQLTDRGAVRAGDVVGVDFKLRLGVDFGQRREQQVMAGLTRGNFLCVFAHQHLTAEDSPAVAAGQAFVEFVAGGVRCRVVDAGLMVDVLAGAGIEQAVQHHLATRRAEFGVDIEPGQTAAKGQGMTGNARIAANAEPQIADVDRAARFGL